MLPVRAAITFTGRTWRQAKVGGNVEMSIVLDKLERTLIGLGLTLRHAQVMSDAEVSMLGRAVGVKTFAALRALPDIPAEQANLLRLKVDEVVAEKVRKRKLEAAEQSARQATEEDRRRIALGFALNLISGSRFGVVSPNDLPTVASRASWARAVSEYLVQYLYDGSDNRKLLQ